MQVHVPFFTVQRCPPAVLGSRTGPAGPSQRVETAGPAHRVVAPSQRVEVSGPAHRVPRRPGVEAAVPAQRAAAPSQGVVGATVAAQRIPRCGEVPPSVLATRCGAVPPSVLAGDADAALAGLRLPPPGTRSRAPVEGPAEVASSKAGTARKTTGAGRRKKEAAAKDAGPAPPAAPAATSGGYPCADETPAPLAPSGTRSKEEALGREGCGSSATTQAPEEADEAPRSGSRSSVVLDAYGKRRVLPAQLEAEENCSQFTCYLCSFVPEDPIITTCSHSFCDRCFRLWAGQQVERVKRTTGDTERPLQCIPCPQPGCQMQLRKKDIIKTDASVAGAAGLINRMRSNLTVRCVHHPDHYKHWFGKDAEELLKKTGVTCSWVGDLTASFEHLRKSCCVERELEHPGTGRAHARRDLERHVTADDDADGVAAMESSVGGARVVAAPAPGRGGQIRTCRHDFNGADESQLTLLANDLIRVMDTCAAGWTAGVRVHSETLEELGDAGWFPEAFLFPLQEEPFQA